MNITKPVILRHDIDFDIGKALKLAKIEAEKQIQSTYFILLNTNFYNVFSSETNKTIKEISKLGHEIGLHFDETRYFDLGMVPSPDKLIPIIQKEAALLEQIIEQPITSVSMHRPSREVLDANISIPDIVNSYSQTFFKEFKYLSDSRHNWREDAEAIVSSGQYERLHILIHPFWYTEEITSCRDKLFSFITSGNLSRYHDVNDNFRDMGEYIKREEIG
jgi:hypothetical protein